MTTRSTISVELDNVLFTNKYIDDRDIPHTVRKLKNALLALSNSNTKSLKKRQAFTRINNMIAWMGWDDQYQVTSRELCALPGLGSKIVYTFIDEMNRRIVHNTQAVDTSAIA